MSGGVAKAKEEMSVAILPSPDNVPIPPDALVKIDNDFENDEDDPDSDESMSGEDGRISIEALERARIQFADRENELFDLEVAHRWEFSIQ